MSDRCSCGADLPEDAVECPNCGKPTSNAPPPAVAPPEPEPPPAAAEPSTKPRIGWSSREAFRAALLAGSLGYFVTALAGHPSAPFVAYPLAGYLADVLFVARTGIRLSRWEGIRLGWMTGTLSFVVMVAFLGVAALFGQNLFGPDAIALMRDQMADRPEELKQAFDEVMSSPAMRGVLLLFMLSALYAMVTVLSAVGAALGTNFRVKR